MQASRLPTAVKEILKNKLIDVANKHVELLKATESLDDQLARVEGQLNILDIAESYNIKDALTLAADMDELLEKMTECHKAVQCISRKNGPGIPKSADLTKKQIRELDQTYRSDCSTTRYSACMDNSDTALNILHIQMEVLQQHVLTLQESHDTRLHELETKVKMKTDECISAGNNFDLRLQHVEARLVLIQDIQIRNDNSTREFESKLSRLRTDVLSVQNGINQLNVHQNVLWEGTQEVKSKADDLVRLRKMLSDLHINVTQREELAMKIAQLEEEVSTLNSVLNSLATQIADNIQGHQDEKDPIPAFVAKAAGKGKVKPGDRICFPVCWQEQNCYDPGTSTFKSPIGGLYYFSVSINADSDGDLCASVMRNSEGVAHCSTSGKKDEQASTTVLLRLVPGDCVWIKANEQTSLEGAYVGGGYSNFIGYFLK